MAVFDIARVDGREWVLIHDGVAVVDLGYVDLYRAGREGHGTASDGGRLASSERSRRLSSATGERRAVSQAQADTDYDQQRGDGLGNRHQYCVIHRHPHDGKVCLPQAV